MQAWDAAAAELDAAGAGPECVDLGLLSQRFDGLRERWGKLFKRAEKAAKKATLITAGYEKKEQDTLAQIQTWGWPRLCLTAVLPWLSHRSHAHPHLAHHLRAPGHLRRLVAEVVEQEGQLAGFTASQAREQAALPARIAQLEQEVATQAARESACLSVCLSVSLSVCLAGWPSARPWSVVLCGGGIASIRTMHPHSWVLDGSRVHA